MKTIAVLGASGKSGQAFIHTALGMGYRIRAGVYSSSYRNNHRNCEIITCDGTIQADVDTLVQGSDVVVSLIGHVKGSPSFLQTETITHVIQAMQKHKIKRLISLTGTGVRRSGDTPSLIDHLVNAAIKIIDPRRVRDGIAHAAVIEQSNVDWSIVRVLKLTNGRSEKNVCFSLGGPAEVLTSRKRLSRAIMQLVQDDSYIRQMPVITKKSM